MQEAKTITLMTGRTRTELEIDTIHYIVMKRNYAEIHADWGEVIRARITMEELEKALGRDFVKVHRSCLVSVAHIRHISDKVVLNSGEEVKYALQKKREIVARVCALRNCAPESIVFKCPRPVGRKTPPVKAAPPSEPENEPCDEEREEYEECEEYEEPVPPAVPEARHLPVVVKRKTLLVNIDTILYIRAKQGSAEIHMLDGEVFKTRTALHLLEEALGDRFIKVSRGCLVSAMAIHSVTETVNLSNGESLKYPPSRKNHLRRLWSSRQKLFIDCLSDKATPTTEEAYRAHYRCFDDMPFAFTDIEMVFNEERRAVDWIFRYGNPALARLEKMPLKKLIGKSFGSVFDNMDSKWLRSYEQAVLYGRTLEIIDYSPEINTTLKIICFPTFRGHCGCILFDLDSIRLSDVGCSEQALRVYLGLRTE